MLRFFVIFFAVALNLIDAGPAKILPLAGKRVITTFTESGDQLYAAGERGHFFVWDNGLKQLPFPEDYMINSLDSVGSDIWAVGYNELIYVRRGTEWIKKSKNERAESVLFSIHFTSEKNGIAVGSFGAAFATNNGNDWEPLDLGIKDAHFYQIKSDKKGNYYIAGDLGTLIKVSPELKVVKEFVHGGIDQPTYFGLEVIDEDDLIAYGVAGRVMHFKGDEVNQLSNPRKEELFCSLKKENDILMFGSDGAILFLRDGVITDKSSSEMVATIIDSIIFQDKLMLGTGAGVREVSLKEVGVH